MDFNALQHKLFALDPTDPSEDLRKLAESAGDMPQESVPITESLAQESVEVQQGTMPVEGDYSLSDFAALAGVTLNESQKTGSAGQAKGKDTKPKMSKPSSTGEQPHPLKDKLVGEDNTSTSAWDAAKAGYAKGKKDYNNLGAIGLGKDDIAGRIDKALGGKGSKSKTGAPKSSTTPYMDANNYKEFLKKHTVSLKKIAADPEKLKRFETWLEKWNEEIEEENKGLYHNVNKRKKAGTSRSKDHPKAPTDKAWKDAAKTAKTESVESIKEMLYRKLNSKK